jgi:hypothetical protein
VYVLKINHILPQKDVRLNALKDNYGLKNQIHVYIKGMRLNLIDVNKLRFGIKKLNNVYVFQTILIKHLKDVRNATLHLNGQLLIKDANIQLLQQVFVMED